MMKKLIYALLAFLLPLSTWSQNINFADSNVKTICVANWDKNKDGELSIEEAAAVTDLGVAFFENTDITSFDELEHFVGLKSISDGAFASCSNLKTITIPDNVTSIRDDAFFDCSSLTVINMPDGIKKFGQNAFNGCSSLTALTIPSNMITIEQGAFSRCSNLKSINIPSSVKTIKEDAFICCPALTSITVDADNTFYDSRDNCNAIIKTASNTLYAGCMNTVIPNSVTTIGKSAFYGCSSLTSVTIPSNVRDIEQLAFTNCSPSLPFPWMRRTRSMIHVTTATPSLRRPPTHC